MAVAIERAAAVRLHFQHSGHLKTASASEGAEHRKELRETSHRKKMTHIIHPMQKYFAIAAIVLFFDGWTGAAAQLRQTVQSKEVSVLGFKLHYLEAGAGAPVVLLHGL